MKKIVCIVGQTASGKTALGIQLAKKLNGEVVSADSRMVYRGMEIGTAVPSGEYRISNLESRALIVEGIPHYLIGVVQPNQLFTLVDWKKQAMKAIAQIHSRQRIPLIVGGTGLYISALVDNYDIPSVKKNAGLRQEIERLWKTKGLFYIAEQLLVHDPAAATIVDLKNPRRVIRALEVCLGSGKPFTSQLRLKKPLYDCLQIGLTVEKEELERRITNRVQEQLRDGLVEEVRKLKEHYGTDIPPMQGFVYKEIVEYLGGKTSLEKAKALIILRNQQYAKRQMTWFKRDKRIHWIAELSSSTRVVKKFIGKHVQ